MMSERYWVWASWGTWKEPCNGHLSVLSPCEAGVVWDLVPHTQEDYRESHDFVTTRSQGEGKGG